MSGAARVRDITPQQWRSGAAAGMGWTFDGLELHIYTLVATPLVVQLLGATGSSDPGVKEKSAYIQAAFLAGWALGGAFFGRLGDRLGRSRTLAFTVLTYALCTGLCAAAQTWWQLMLFRFLAALGIGGEWAVGAALLAETWPTAWRPWLAAILQTGVNLGILFGALAVPIVAGLTSERFVFLLGVLPALLVFWIRRQVPEPEAWERAEAAARTAPRVRELFQGGLARVTWHTTAVCALSLSAWWLFAFWHPQHLRQLLQSSGAPPGEITRRVSAVFFVVNVLAIAGNFTAGWLARRLGNRRAIIAMLLGLFASMAGAYAVPRGFGALDSAHRLLLRGLRPLHDVPAAALSHAAADDRRGFLLQHRAPGGGGRLSGLRLGRPRRGFSPRPLRLEPPRAGRRRLGLVAAGGRQGCRLSISRLAG